MSAVRCRGVRRSFTAGGTPTPVLRGIDLDVPAGRLTMVSGPSGCGKTTLLCLLAALLEPDAGEIEVLGQPLGALDARARALFRRAHLGFVFQQYQLLPALTAAENAAVPLLVAGIARREAVARADAVLTSLGMGSRLRALPRELSGGQAQRVALARAVVHGPRLLLCDEPTAALDATAGHAVMELLRAAAGQDGRAVVVVTHDPRVASFADRQVRLEDGRVISVEDRT
jgi:putative ABC transport system ATP-binding protein